MLVDSTRRSALIEEGKKIEINQLAIFSVSDKTGIVELAKILVENGLQIVASGGTAKYLRQNEIYVTDVSAITKFNEMLDGRVKTLHPAVHAGILARQNNSDIASLKDNGFDMFSVVICNLYPFNECIAKENCTVSEAIENIDIGGVTLLRAAAKNFERVTVLCDPNDYNFFIKELKAWKEKKITTKDEKLEDNFTLVSPETRKLFALKAFEQTSAYDESISNYMRHQLTSKEKRLIPLRYGINPHQIDNAEIYSLQVDMPIQVLNGAPGYINILDGLNGWQLVNELTKATNLPAASSFKHVSPAGAALGIPLSETESQAYFVADIGIDTQNPSLAAAYARARGADRMSSYGDFIALSQICDEITAKVISREVSDGVIAPDYEKSALEILAKKKNGKFIILKINPKYLPAEDEVRTIFGLKLKQKRNNAVISTETFSNVLSKNKNLPKTAIQDLVVATIAIKYTQSNSVCFAYQGQVIGIGAGQQSRIHCTRIAGEKTVNWWLRQHPYIINLPWKPNIRRAEKSNIIEALLAGVVLGNCKSNNSSISNETESLPLINCSTNVTKNDANWKNEFFSKPVFPLTQEMRSQWLNQLKDVCMSSDAFFPFRDNIDCAKQYGVKFIAHPGGSTRDDEVLKACEEHGITLIQTGIRLFHH